MRRRATGIALSVAVAVAVAVAACSGDPPPPDGVRPAGRAIDASLIRIAGSGAMVPLARALMEAWPGRTRVVVEDSIGSGGGVRAAGDGVVDLGLVSRTLGDGESGLGLIQVPAGLDAVVIAAHPAVRVDGVGSDELRAIYAGERRAFSDGEPATVLLRDRRDSANAALERAVPGLSAAGDPRRRGRVLYHDGAMLDAIAATPGALGVTNLGGLTAAHSRLKVLALDGRTPSLATLADGSWPAVRALAWVMRPDRADHVRAFLDFAGSAEGARIARANGYLPSLASSAATAVGR